MQVTPNFENTVSQNIVWLLLSWTIFRNRLFTQEGSDIYCTWKFYFIPICLSIMHLYVHEYTYMYLNASVNTYITCMHVYIYMQVCLYVYVLKTFLEFPVILLKKTGHFAIIIIIILAESQGMWNLSCPTRDWTHTSCLGRQSLNHWTTREAPLLFYFEWPPNVFKSPLAGHRNRHVCMYAKLHHLLAAHLITEHLSRSIWQAHFQCIKHLLQTEKPRLLTRAHFIYKQISKILHTSVCVCVCEI